MTAGDLPTARDRLDVIRVALTGIAEGAELEALVRLIEPLRRNKGIFPGDVLLGLGADALREAHATRDQPVDFGGVRERFLPELEFRGNAEHQKSHYALRAAAMMHGGVQPDLVEDVGWWKVNDLWLFALYALVIYVRVAAERLHGSAAEVCERIAARQGMQLTGMPD